MKYECWSVTTSDRWCWEVAAEVATISYTNLVFPKSLITLCGVEKNVTTRGQQLASQRRARVKYRSPFYKFVGLQVRQCVKQDHVGGILNIVSLSLVGPTCMHSKKC